MFWVIIETKTYLRTTLSAKSVFEVILTLLVFAAVRRIMGVTYLIEEQ